MKKALLYGSLIGAGIGFYALFRNRPETITIEEELAFDDAGLLKTTTEDVFLIASDGLPLALSIVRPTYRPIKAVVQIVHGILEHRKRYLHFANHLAENGYAVVISDNRGHGQSVNEQFVLGHMPGMTRMVEDQAEITQFVKQRFAHKPVYLYGHSFGSMLARVYLQKHDAEIDKLLLTGTVQYEKNAKMGCLIAEIANKVAGEHGFSWILKKLSDFDSKDKTWLTNSEEHLEEAMNDPWMIPGYDNRGVATIWQTNRELKNVANFACRHPELPILSITGAEDYDITGGNQGLLDTENTLRRIGYHQIDVIDLPQMKHEVLNEVESPVVYQLIVDFFDEN